MRRYLIHELPRRKATRVRFILCSHCRSTGHISLFFWSASGDTTRAMEQVASQEAAFTQVGSLLSQGIITEEQGDALNRQIVASPLSDSGEHLFQAFWRDLPLAEGLADDGRLTYIYGGEVPEMYQS